MPNVKLISQTLGRLAEVNAAYFRENGDLPAALVIAPSHEHAGAVDVMPLEALVAPQVRKAIRNAALTVTCIEGYLAEQHASAPMPDRDTIEHNPDARHCYVYFAQTPDVQVCAVQFVLKPELGAARLSPLKVLDNRTVAVMDPQIAALARPGQSLQ